MTFLSVFNKNIQDSNLPLYCCNYQIIKKKKKTIIKKNIKPVIWERERERERDLYTNKLDFVHHDFEFFLEKILPPMFRIVHNPTFMFGKWANNPNLVFAHFPYIEEICWFQKLWTIPNIEEEKHFYYFFFSLLAKTINSISNKGE